MWPSGSSVSPGGCRAGGSIMRSLRPCTTTRRRPAAAVWRPDAGGRLYARSGARPHAPGGLLGRSGPGAGAAVRAADREQPVPGLGRLRQLRRERRPAAPRRAIPVAGRWEDSGGHNHASPLASADIARETANSAPLAEEPLRQTNPIHPGAGGQGSGVGNLKSDSRPLSPVLSRQTKPISEAVSSLRGPGSNADRPGRVWDLLDQACERQPVWTGVRHPAGLAAAGERRRTGKR